MDKNEAMRKIYDIVREIFPDSICVDITVDIDGLTMSSDYRLIGKYSTFSDSTICNGPCERVLQ